MLLSTALLSKAQSLYPGDFIKILSCETNDTCFGKLIGNAGYELNEHTISTNAPTLWASIPDTVFLNECSGKFMHYYYKSRYMYKVGIGGRWRTEDMFFYDFCEEMRQLTFFTSITMYFELYIEKALNMGFVEDTSANLFKYRQEERQFTYTNNGTAYRLYTEPYDQNEDGRMKDGINVYKLQRYRIRMKARKVE